MIEKSGYDFRGYADDAYEIIIDIGDRAVPVLCEKLEKNCKPDVKIIILRGLGYIAGSKRYPVGPQTKKMIFQAAIPFLKEKNSYFFSEALGVIELIGYTEPKMVIPELTVLVKKGRTKYIRDKALSTIRDIDPKTAAELDKIKQKIEQWHMRKNKIKKE